MMFRTAVLKLKARGNRVIPLKSKDGRSERDINIETNR